VLFDLETQLSAADVGGWQNAHRMLVAIGVVCHLDEGRLESFGEPDVDSLIERLERADLVVGFNIARFDYKVLSGYTGVDYRQTLPTLDLLEEIHKKLGFRLSLDHLANATLGVSKSADGLQSLEWVKQGRLDLVEEYCRRDVEILRDLYLFGRRMGHVLYVDRDDRKVKLPVEW
jgi:DEAD/DEAH box helicase domain-containing protein